MNTSKGYKKYKTNYKSIKAELNKNQMSGGGFFKKGYESTYFYIMAKITNDYIYSRLDERRKAILGENASLKNLHITLFQCEINQNHPNANVFQNVDFHEHIKKSYVDAFSKNNITLTSKLGEYDILGTDNKFLVKKYTANDSQIITEFRKQIYQYLDKQFGSGIKKEKQDFVVYNYNGQDLIAVPRHSHGVGVWTPHVSIINTNELKKLNPTLYNQYMNLTDKQQQINLLLQPIFVSQFKPIGPIKLKDDIKEIIVSVQNLNINLSKSFNYNI